MTHATRTRSLEIAALILIGTGAAMVASIFTPLRPVFELFLGLAFLSGGMTVGDPAAQLMTGISGGVLAGWGLTLWAVTRRVYVRDTATGRAIILPGVALWFVLDGTGSVASGAWFNVVLNGGFAALFAVPLLWPADQSRP